MPGDLQTSKPHQENWLRRELMTTPVCTWLWLKLDSPKTSCKLLYLWSLTRWNLGENRHLSPGGLLPIKLLLLPPLCLIPSHWLHWGAVEPDLSWTPGSPWAWSWHLQTVLWLSPSGSSRQCFHPRHLQPESRCYIPMQFDQGLKWWLPEDSLHCTPLRVGFILRLSLSIWNMAAVSPPTFSNSSQVRTSSE